jgi:hypothetical protein
LGLGREPSQRLHDGAEPAMLLENHGRKRAGSHIPDSVEPRNGVCQIEQLMAWRQAQGQ